VVSIPASGPHATPVAAVNPRRPLAWLLSRLPPVLAAKGGVAKPPPPLAGQSDASGAPHPGTAPVASPSVVIYSGGLLPVSAGPGSFDWDAGLRRPGRGSFSDVALDDGDAAPEPQATLAHSTVFLFDPKAVKVRYAVHVAV
jgi:hypothetical protein